MARTGRMLFDDVIYHVVSRGIQKQAVFRDRDDFTKYTKILWKYKNKFPSRIYAYCLMPNHVHLVLDPFEKDSLKKVMHGINLSYAMYYNCKYERSGHLWENRYKSFLVQKDQYLINVVSYVEYNPVRANICERAEEYPWSSYKFRVLGGNNKLLDRFEGGQV